MARRSAFAGSECDVNRCGITSWLAGCASALCKQRRISQRHKPRENLESRCPNHEPRVQPWRQYPQDGGRDAPLLGLPSRDICLARSRENGRCEMHRVQRSLPMTSDPVCLHTQRYRCGHRRDPMTPAQWLRNIKAHRRYIEGMYDSGRRPSATTPLTPRCADSSEDDGSDLCYQNSSQRLHG